ncbi:ead/Ea22-like family protein [Citrobacter freundii]|uniref:ead/Ea22-like family protein n=1 Tax=Citrobacter freundii TaxID=546 RepID=UPI0027A69B05|nr:ead/Ea22-like family protein [Citrobacter freundii]EKU1724145.1 ead/Ea22-like family protein [Citrobacter freundii]EKX7236581.1 ead/Ea22-like family protein [Citrobacter freundii]WBG09188.1 ead/Ea22-like family protein [Citrobacter freundii]HCB1540648.1 ead/Ea22-like family protein [Citrobacter freundii]
MTALNKQALREAAENATPGRIGDRIDGSGSIKYQCFGNDGSLVLQTDHKNMEYGFIGDNSDSDELFFRLCDPATVLALLDELEVAEKRIAELEARTITVKQFDDFQIVHYGGSEDYAKGYIDCQNNYNKALTAR